jgi:siroheme synthase-like protein
MKPSGGLALYITLEDTRCVCVGGGRVAARRALALLEAGAQVTVIAPTMVLELGTLAHERLLLVPRAYESTDVLSARLVVAATNNPEVNAQVARDARAAGALTVVAGAPDLGDCHFMAMIRRGPLEVGIHSHGLAPAVTAAVRHRLQDALPMTLEAGLAAVGELRTQLQTRVHDPVERQRRWRDAVDAGAMERLLEGEIDRALDILRYTLLRE